MSIVPTNINNYLRLCCRPHTSKYAAIEVMCSRLMVLLAWTTRRFLNAT